MPTEAIESELARQGTPTFAAALARIPENKMAKRAVPSLFESRARF